MPDAYTSTLAVFIDRDRLSELCLQHGVETLDVFGSATNQSFSPDTSDLDLIVSFENEHVDGFFDRYFDLKSDLEQLFDRRVDLLTAKPIENPYFRSAVEKQRRRLYPIS